VQCNGHHLQQQLQQQQQEQQRQQRLFNLLQIQSAASLLVIQ
jgi:hypothetical protein